VVLVLTVLQTSETNDMLSQIHKKDLQGMDSTNGIIADNARLVITLKDRSGTSAFQLEDAYITGYPEVTFTGDFSQRAWTIKSLSSSEFTVGGNLRPSTSFIDKIFNAI